MVVDAGEAEVGERQAPQRGTASSGSTADLHVVEQARRAASSTSLSCSLVTAQRRGRGPHRLPRPRARSPSRRCSPSRPRGRPRAVGVDPDVLAATEAGEVDLGFVAIENSIEGTVNVTLDTLAFEWTCSSSARW